MERVVLKISMFQTLALAVIAIYFGEFLRKKFPILKKYCLPASVVGGTIFAIISTILYSYNIFELQFDFAVANKLFYNIFFAASGAAASMALLKKGGKLVVIFAILAAVAAAGQNALALLVGKFVGVSPLIAMMTGSIPMTGGHGNAAAFAPIAVEAGATAAMEVAIASATFGLISGCIIGGPLGNFIIKRHKLEDPALDGKGEIEEEGGNSSAILMTKSSVINAMFLMCIAIGIGEIINLTLKKYGINFPIHVSCMFGGILIRLFYDAKGGNHDVLYEAIDTVGEYSLGLFVSMSIITMKLWQLADLGPALVVLLVAQVIFIILFCYLLTFNLLGRNYDAAVMAVGHTGFGLGAVPVSMTTMQAVSRKYRYSKLAFFVVPVIGGFISNISNAMIITYFLNLAKSMMGIG
ncbi:MULTISPECIES: sodium/glutamate symporter [Fusobacterium]|uniref:sodium/glutamate symporter n=1 Tax=Fusobacterium TaxID=848 RepID=UPI0025B9629B|nr:sodium/glutamate symporter [Fusobacterium sp.]MCI7223100.1 sodium/glutamate symporter [Fusobacterium sp.]MDD7410815.1 sodium/glutamate symporter [Fusobacteriaceae bacterium]MDY5713168.1 sodium/glutamate symporter [Fusobacterium gastrosuis]